MEIRYLVIVILSVFSCSLSFGQNRMNILDAAYSWDNEQFVLMQSSDGTFDSAVENILSGSDVLFPSGGVHILNIKVMDEDGNWSPIFKRVIDLPLIGNDRLLHISQAEFFWDVDPGEGLANQLIVFDGQYNEAVESVFSNPINLESGLHTFNIRVKDIQGNWSAAFRRVVVLEGTEHIREMNILNAQYKWDDGEYVTLLAFDGDFNNSSEQIISNGFANFPSGGVHVLSLRIMDEDGNWSPYFKRIVELPLGSGNRDFHITQAELFWDEDPGEGEASQLIAFDWQFDEAVETLLSGVEIPNEGIHTLGVRVKDIGGVWGPVFKRIVVIEGSELRELKISHAEFFWDQNDPIDLIAFDGDYSSAVEIVSSDSSLEFPTSGVHVLNLRLQDEYGNWSPVFKRVVDLSISNASRAMSITQAEYFWDTDPGEGNANQLIGIDGELNHVVEEITSGFGMPLYGIHVLNIRLKDIDGTWGPVYKRVVNFELVGGLGCVDENACNFNSEALYDDGSCEYMPETDCDCYGSQLDAINVCGGNCEADIDMDGVCDSLEIYGCTDELAFNFNPLATEEDNSCFYLGCVWEQACNYSPLASIDDGSCLFVGDDCNDGEEITINDVYVSGCICQGEIIYGCLSPYACNYDEYATVDDGGCEYETCVGCLDSEACNFNPIATYPALCVWPDEGLDCEGNCLEFVDLDSDGFCDYAEVGCTDELALNYQPNATQDDGSCILPIYGCTNIIACNYVVEANLDDQSCDFESCVGCMENQACNYDPSAMIDSGECSYPEDGYNCDGECISDLDEDGVCDEYEVYGCIDIQACNYNPFASESNGSCEYPEQFYNCDGVCENDTDGDEVCDELEIYGCIHTTACNYDPIPTEDDDSCFYIGDECDDGDLGTENDEIQLGCECIGQPIASIQEVIGVKYIVYPNPTSGIVTIECVGGSHSIVNVGIKNIAGQEVMNDSFINSSTIDLSALEKGVYFADLKAVGSKVVVKITLH